MIKIKIIMHVHTRYSYDSIASLWSIYLMCKIKKISCIAITDHNSIEGAVKFKEKYEKKGIKVIVGEEIMTTSGEIIGLFLKKEVKRGLTPDETIDEIINQEGLVYIPHPFDIKRNKTVVKLSDIERNKNRINFIECHNGRNVSEEYGIKQNEIAEKFNIMKVVGSDAHTILELGRNYMDINYFTTKDEFVKSISNAKFTKKPCLSIFHQITRIVKLVKMIKRRKYNEIFRIINKKIRK